MNLFPRERERPSLDLSWQRLTWDSEMLGLSCGLIDCGDPMAEMDDDSLRQQIEGLILEHEEVEFLTIKLPTRFKEATDRLIGNGARFIDTELTFKYQPRPSAAASRSVVFSSSAEFEAFAPLAQEMKFSRFFLDPGIPFSKALNLWTESIRNYCQGRANELALAFRRGQPVGLATLNLCPGMAIKLHIVGVLREFQGQGVGSELLSAVTSRYGQDYDIAVETLSMNTPAQRLYQKAGFEVDSRRHVLHLWHQPRQ